MWNIYIEWVTRQHPYDGGGGRARHTPNAKYKLNYSERESEWESASASNSRKVVIIQRSIIQFVSLSVG